MTAGAQTDGGRVLILDPRGLAEERIGGASPRLASLEDKTVGIVIDGPWRSWYVFSEILQERLQERDITATRLSVNRLDINTDGLDLDTIQVELDRDTIEKFAGEVDAVVVGLGN